MKEFIDKLIERLEEEKKYCSYNPKIRDEAINKAISIINELAEEYKGKSNNTFETIYDKVCSLEKKYANDGNVESVNDCIKLENLLQYFKEELQSAEEYNGGWIPCSERLPDTEHISGVSESVLVTTNINSIFTAEYHGNGKWLDDVADWSLDVIAWQPLPAPYTEGE